MTSQELFAIRQALLQTYLRERGHDGVLLSRADNFAMATGGRRNYIWTYGDVGSNAIFVPAEGRALYVGDTIEKPRIMDEELSGLDCGSVDYLWFTDSPAGAIAKRFAGKNIVSDDGSIGKNVHGELAIIRALLTEGELEKFRILGKLAGEAMTATLDLIEEGMTENEIAATLVAEGLMRSCQVPVALIAADERIAKYRHPLPTQEPLMGPGLQARAVRGYVEVVGCFLREGLVVSLTRFKRVGDLPAGVEEAYPRICAVDAAMQVATVPGRTLGHVFAACQQAYADYGFPANEWHNHHQGGSTGYAGRTCFGRPGETFPVLDSFWPAKLKERFGMDVAFGSAFAWNPSASGVKSEDTFLLLPNGTKELVSVTPALPVVDLAPILGMDTGIIKYGMAE